MDNDLNAYITKQLNSYSNLTFYQKLLLIGLLEIRDEIHEEIKAQGFNYYDIREIKEQDPFYAYYRDLT